MYLATYWFIFFNFFFITIKGIKLKRQHKMKLLQFKAGKSFIIKQY